MKRDIIKQNFGQIWPIHVKNLTELLITFRESIGDLDLVIVLSVVGRSTMSERRAGKFLNYEKLFGEWEGLPEPEAINTRSIADYTGIPRETVRRKINELVERGWVTRDSQGSLKVTARCAKDLEATTDHGIDYLSRMLELLAALKPVI